MSQKTLIRDNEENIYSPNPTEAYEEYSYLPQTTTLQGAYEMQSIKPTVTNIVTPEGGQNEETTASQETRENRDALNQRKKWALQLCLSIFCFVCIIFAASAIFCKIFEKLTDFNLI